MILATTPETAKLVLSNEDLFYTRWPESTSRLMGEYSFACLPAAAHKRLRALTMRTINGYDMLSRYIPRIEKLALTTLDAWAGRDRMYFLDELRPVRRWLLHFGGGGRENGSKLASMNYIVLYCNYPDDTPND